MGVDGVGDSTLKHNSACVSPVLFIDYIAMGVDVSPDTRLCMCKYLSYLLIIQLWVWMWSGFHWVSRLCMC